jgi:3-phenylpropionate/trans-cinnamate dioxygenase ferredoxin reductase subunit
VPREIVIAGASVAGVGVADELRRLGYDGRLILLNAESHAPYDRPPLSKGLLTGKTSAERVALRAPGHFADHAIDLRTGVAAARLSPGPELALTTGEVLRPDAVVIATGARARRLRRTPYGTAAAPAVRDLDDALWLRDRLAGRPRLVVIGGGFVGAEVAASARGLGLDVTMIEAAPLPLAGLVGEEAARALLRPHRDAGVRVLCGVPVTGVERSRDGTERVALADGRVVTGDLVVAGLGAVPNTEWLTGSGLDTEDGVGCDATGATALPGVYAAGDAAAWPDPRSGRRARHEHWTRAREQARTVAARLLGREAPAPGPAYFWSDQYGRRVQSLGDTARADTVQVVHGHLGADSWVALYGRGGRLTGAVGYNAAAALMRHRPAVAEGAPLPATDAPLAC